MANNVGWCMIEIISNSFLVQGERVYDFNNQNTISVEQTMSTHAFRNYWEMEDGLVKK